MLGQTIKRHMTDAREQNAGRQTCRAYSQPQSGGRLNRYDKNRSENRHNLRKMNGKLNKRKISPIRYIRAKITNITQDFQIFTIQNKKDYFSRKFDKLRYFSLVPRPPMTIFFIGTTSTNDDIFHWSDLTMSVVKNDQ